MKENEEHHSKCPDEDDQPCDNRTPQPCLPTQAMACNCRCGRGIFRLCLSNYGLLFRHGTSVSGGSSGDKHVQLSAHLHAEYNHVSWSVSDTTVSYMWFWFSLLEGLKASCVFLRLGLCIFH